MELIIFWILFAIIGAMIGSSKNAAFAGFMLGLLLGPIGLIIAALMKGDRVNCPHCDTRVSPHAYVCPHCGGTFEDLDQDEEEEASEPENEGESVGDSNLSIGERLEQLRELHDQGLISEEEFSKRRREIIREI